MFARYLRDEVGIVRSPDEPIHYGVVGGGGAYLSGPRMTAPKYDAELFPDGPQ